MKRLKFINKLPIMLLLIAIFSLNCNGVKALNNEVNGNKDGIIIKNKENPVFSLKNMIPGDSKTSTINIKNEDNNPFDLYLKMEKEGQEELNKSFCENLNMKIMYKDKELYKGTIEECDKNRIKIGKFNPGKNEEIKVYTYLNGKESGNEIQNKKMDLKFVFTAISDIPQGDSTKEKNVNGKINITPSSKKTLMPKTGQVNPIIFYILGSCLIILGIKVSLENNKIRIRENN